MAPAKRKAQSTAQSGSKKSQKKGKGKASEQNVPVDDTFGEDGKAKVYIDDDGTIFDASLNRTNIGDNNNKFYFLQLLASDAGDTYYTHTRWGRVGETGQTKTLGPSSFDEALEDFEKKFKSKTGLEWSARQDEPKSNKYTFVEKNYEEDGHDAGGDDGADGNGDNTATVKSELPIETQRLMELIFNENHFNSVLEEIGYNKDKLPLGKLGKSTLKTGFEHLRELASLIKHPSLAENKYGVSREEAIEDFSNKYYSTIPHVFGRDRAPLIDNDDRLKREVAMLDTLTDMEVANTIMHADGKSKDAASVNMLDKHFKGLNLKELTHVKKGTKEYNELVKYLIDSSSSGHGIKFRVQDIFRIERAGEASRFNKSRFAKVKDKNRLLLWHGSRTTNYGGILSQGLRIAPPEAPASGYAFGKGVYLADISSKSAGYCVPSMSGGVGLLMLCEAELSRPLYEIPSGDIDAEEKSKKANCIATKGVGKTVPLKWKDAGCLHDNLKGVMMPDGKPGDNKNHKGGFLQYNEYICYDVAQLQLRYLFRIGM